jgi:hypothetical protein
MSVLDLALYSGVYKSCLLFSRAFRHQITTHLFSLIAFYFPDLWSAEVMATVLWLTKRFL